MNYSVHFKIRNTGTMYVTHKNLTEQLFKCKCLLNKSTRRPQTILIPYWSWNLNQHSIIHYYNFYYSCKLHLEHGAPFSSLKQDWSSAILFASLQDIYSFFKSATGVLNQVVTGCLQTWFSCFVESYSRVIY